MAEARQVDRLARSSSPPRRASTSQRSQGYDSNPANKGKVFFLTITTNLNAYSYGNDESGWPSFAVPVPSPPDGGLAGLWGDAGSVCDTVGVVTRFLKTTIQPR
jgi:hypothetical protein